MRGDFEEPTFDAYRRKTFKDTHYVEWLNGVLALLYARLALEEMRESMEYQQARYGTLIEQRPMRTIGEGGPEFFMPLHDPESAKRFRDFLDK